MNAIMNIQVRVINGNARSVLRSLRTDIDGMNRALGDSDRRANRSSRSLMAWGNQVQWTGRQIQYNFTLPLLAAGAAAAHWQLENEKAMTRVTKVYGDASLSAETMKNELKSLGDAFQELSNHFGVQQSEVLAIAGDWAAAGSSGLALAKSVQTTLQAMVLGELEAAEATKALIAIQAQYGLSSAKLAETIGILNAVENQTGISMAGLIKGFQRSAGVARTAGVDVRHLAAMLAAISPAAGSAAEAGNALKTIFSRLASPTRETTQVLGLMGVSMQDMEWKSATATEQLQIMSKKFEELSDKQKEVVSTVVASRWQINKFSILMRELASENGYYQKALDATASRQHVFNLYQKELNTVLSSNPRRLQIIWTMLQNAATDIIQPMIPLILYMANAVRLLVQSFANLDPALQKLIIFGLLAIAVIGPLIRYAGSLVTLIGMLGPVIMTLLFPITALFGAIGAVIGGAVGAIAFVWTTLFTNLVGIAWVGIGAIQAAWAAGLFGIRAMLSIAGMIILTRWRSLMLALPATMAAAQVMLRTVWINGLLALAAIQIAAGAVLTRAWVTTLVAMRAAWASFMVGIAAVSSVIYPTIVAIWAGMMYRIYAVMRASSALILATYRAFAFGLSPIAAAGGALLAATWRGVQVAVQAVLLAGAIAQAAIWRLFAFGLAPITAAAGALLTAAWVATIRAQMVVMAAAQRAWAVAWAGMVAIAAAASRLIALAMPVATAAMVFMATVPGRLIAVFKAGWVMLILVAKMGVRGIAGVIVSAVSAISWPVVAVIAAVLIIVAGFWDELKTIWNNIVSYFSNSGNSLVAAVRNIFGSLGGLMSKVFNKLPESVKNAMVAVVRLVAAAARKVYELFSYINPFARHSPSLVDNVTNGMAEVRKQFSTLSEVEGYVKSAYETISQFGSATAGLAQSDQNAEFAEKRENVVSQAPGAGPAFDAMVAQINKLTPVLNTLKVAVAAQQAVVDQWSAALDKANSKLDIQQKKLDGLQKIAGALQDQLNAAKGELDTWADTPIKGQQAMSDAIFANTMAQKKLQLQMMDMEKVTGPLDDIKSKMASIHGEMDQLQGMRSSLQQGGAGSDILGFYDEQLAKLGGEGGGLSEQAKALQEMQKELDRLAKGGQRLDLENSLKFDPLIRQIEQASKSMKEMPFDEILAGIASSKVKVDELTAAYDEANEAVKQQQEIVDAAAAARDAIQARYDAESKKLSQLKDQYDAINQAIQDITSSLNDMSQAADSAVNRKKKKKEKKGGADSLSPGAQNFLDAEGGNFPDPGADAAIGREGGIGDQSKMIDDFTKDLAKETSGMFAGLNPMGPLKRWWDRAWEWLKTYIGPLFSGLGEFLSEIFNGIEIPGGSGNLLQALTGWVPGAMDLFVSLATTITNVFTTLWDFLAGAWELVAPVLGGIWDALIEGLVAAWELIRPELAKFGELLAPLGEAISNLWTLIKPIIAIIGGALVAVFLLIANVVKNTLGPIIEMIGGIIAGVIRVIRGVIEFIVGVFTGDWEMAWQGIKDIFGGVWDILASIVTGAWDIILGILEGAIDWVSQIFSFVWDKWLGPAWDKAWAYISDMAVSAWDTITQPFIDAYNWVKDTFSIAWEIIETAWPLAWETIKTEAQNAWDTITKPFVDAYNWLEDKFSIAWEVIKTAWPIAWEIIRTKAKGAWDTITKPFKDAYNWLKDTFTLAWEVIKRAWPLAWEIIRSRAKSAWDTITKPFRDAYNWVTRELSSMWDKVRSAWDLAWGLIKGKAKDAWEAIKNPIRDGVNSVIGYINKLISGLNKVADFIPGLDWEISLIPKLASGGGIPSKMVGSGFKTNGPRAIVGEGNPRHPEYVIPTDPQYRSRATGLFQMLSRDLGMAQSFVGPVPAFAGGGILDSIGDAMGDAGSFFSGLGTDILGYVSDGVVKHIMKPYMDLADPMINKIPWEYLRAMAKSFKGRLTDWIDVADEVARDKVEAGGAGNVPAGQIKEWILKALSIIKEPTSLAHGIYNIIKHESGGNPRAINRWDSNAAQGYDMMSKGLMQTIGPTFRAHSIPGHKDIWNPIDNIIAGTRYAISRYGRTWLKNGGNRDKNGNYIGYEIGGVLGQIPSLSEGAYIRRKAGGTVVRVGEGLTDEAVIPLPNGKSDLAGKTINFYGDLSFPNIRSGEDAKSFIENLETLTAR